MSADPAGPVDRSHRGCGPRAPRRRAAAAVLAAVGALVGPGSAPAPAAPPSPAVVAAQATDPHGGHAPAGDAVEARISFERLLGNHATLTARFMRARMQSGVDLFETADQALVANTEEMRGAVASLVGEEAAGDFEELWVSHVDVLADYARAVADDDGAGRDTALAGLGDFGRRYGAFISTATGGAVPAPDAEANIAAHLGHLTGHVDAYATGDYVGAFRLQREAYAHMFPVAGALAGGIATATGGEAPVAADPAAQQVRSRLGMLLGEHFELAVEAMRSGVTGSEDFAGVAEALNGNTRDLTTALDSLFGPGVATAFSQAWAGHTELLMRYTAAVADGDDAGAEAVLGELAALRHPLATTFSELTAGAVPVDAVAATLSSHDQQLVDQVVAYAAEDYERAYELSFEGYHHMFDVAAVLAPGIELRVLSQLPQGGPQTGGGGTALRQAPASSGAIPACGWLPV